MKTSTLALVALLASGTTNGNVDAFSVNPPPFGATSRIASPSTTKRMMIQTLFKTRKQIRSTRRINDDEEDDSLLTTTTTTTSIPAPPSPPQTNNEYSPQSVEDLIPFNGKTYKFTNMVNDGPFSWMVPYLNIIGFQEGKTLVNAIPTIPTQAGNISEEEAVELRRKAAEDFTNIGEEERQRRGDSATIAYYVTALYAAYSALVLDDGYGDLDGHLYKFLAVLPLFFARGLQLSSQQGL
mmetsp:Transcript_12604/g.19533  ORF Transcript_12604/g.19533 Transcript_12604/m.19533 type:complete len:239 (-) Transcript_12604:39-755(-)|eukprot:CAMPEP_0195309822 /NCGR_PEP_ID=MMETSP0707-20130614/38935_1 /TAXON_ID=33640 /ORGANISM="Asterionellopsis glacialis, Strain CCMP134" /LENGTH=238 /DNA_ID=CAMNT_0040374123 /DNA_START=48 /DNA_END=764 /DNA_ORIENTATION=+